MIVNEVGMYKLTKDLLCRGSISVHTLKKGTLLRVTQLDKQYNKVYSPEIGDWHYFDLPVEKIKPIPKDQRKGKKERIFSTNFPDNFNLVESKCFVPWEDWLSLKKRYIKLFKRYQREMKRKD